MSLSYKLRSRVMLEVTVNSIIAGFLVYVMFVYVPSMMEQAGHH